MKFLFPTLLWTIPFFAAPVCEKVMICGVCQNIERELPATIKIAEEMGSLFEDYRIVVYENNSTDRTVPLLKEWQKKNPRVRLICENISQSELASQVVNLNGDGSFYRAEMIARARNIILDQVLTDQYTEFPYLIWMDMDFRVPAHLEGLVEIFQTDREWDAVFAYGVDPYELYWDWYAFRDSVNPLGSELLGNAWWYAPKKWGLSASDDWYPVYSAFGGCGVYKKSSIIGCRYSAVVTKDLEEVARQCVQEGIQTKHPQIHDYLRMNEKFPTVVAIDRPLPNLPPIVDPTVGFHCFKGADPLVWRMSSFVYQYPSVCEHVTFHASMIVQGHGKLFINPRLIFRYGGPL
jgi:glycosyltransferase involved in cell wall biosynthesis